MGVAAGRRLLHERLQGAPALHPVPGHPSQGPDPGSHVRRASRRDRGANEGPQRAGVCSLAGVAVLRYLGVRGDRSDPERAPRAHRRRPMKITALDTYFLSAPLPAPVRTSNPTIGRVSELIVTLTTDAGHVGIGEAHGPFLSQGGQEGMRVVGQILERITPLVVGQDPFAVERIWQDLFSLTYTSVRGILTLAHQRRQLVTAISAIDIALWDLVGKATGRPVHALLGGALRSRIPAYVTGFYYRDG